MERASASAPQALEGIRQFVSSLVMLFGLRTVFATAAILSVTPVNDAVTPPDVRIQKKQLAGREERRAKKKRSGLKSQLERHKKSTRL